MGPPGQLTAGKDRLVKENQSPYMRAYAVVENKGINLLPLFFELNPIINVTETVSPPIPTPPLGGPVYGSVFVETSILVHPKFAISFLKLGPITLTASKTCPYTWVMQSQIVL